MKRVLPALGFSLLILLLWEVGPLALRIPEYLLPRPSVVVTRLVESVYLLAPYAAVTALEAVAGFIMGSVFGVLLATVFVHWRVAELSMYPYAIALKTVPIVAIAPLLVVWFGSGLLPKIAVAALICFFPAVVNTLKGLRSIDTEALDLFESLSASRWQLFIKLRVPRSLPYLFAALRISSTLAVIGAIVGEFSGADRGLGFYILISSHRLETVDMFVGILLSSLLGVGFFYAVAFLERLCVPWSGTAGLALEE